jgi:hypothetical protein
VAEPKRLLPFRYMTRQRRQPFAKTVPFVSNAPIQTLEVPKYGFASRLIIRVTGVMTLGAGSSALYKLADKGPWDLLKRLRVSMNVGVGVIDDISGYGLYNVGAQIERAFAFNKAGAGDTTPDASIYSAPVVVGANTWVLTYAIPIAANDSDNFEMGLINVQSPQVTMNLAIVGGLEFGDAVAALSGTGHTAAFVGNLNCWYEFFDIPDPTVAEYPPLVIHRLIEDSQPINSTGNQVYTVPKMGTLLQAHHIITLNGARCAPADIVSIQLWENGNDLVYDDDPNIIRMLQRLQTGVEFPAGVYLRNLWHSQEGVGFGDVRDAINTENISVIESRVNISGSATLGSGNNTLATVRRLIQYLQG